MNGKTKCRKCLGYLSKTMCQCPDQKVKDYLERADKIKGKLHTKYLISPDQVIEIAKLIQREEK